MPHRREVAEGDLLDARLESTIGRYFYAGKITQAEYDAGVRYGETILDYLQSIDAPGSHGEGFDDLAEDICFRRKEAAAHSRQILKDAAKAYGLAVTKVIVAVDRLTVYGEHPRNDLEERRLRIGLQALAGSNVIPFGRPAPRQGSKN